MDGLWNGDEYWAIYPTTPTQATLHTIPTQAAFIYTIQTQETLHTFQRRRRDIPFQRRRRYIPFQRKRRYIPFKRMRRYISFHRRRRYIPFQRRRPRALWLRLTAALDRSCSAGGTSHDQGSVFLQYQMIYQMIYIYVNHLFQGIGQIPVTFYVVWEAIRYKLLEC